jgi:hypothetical protein
MKDATAGAKDRKAARDKADNCNHVYALIRKTMADQVPPEELRTFQLYTPELVDQDKDPLYYRINRMMDRDLEDFARGTKMMKALGEACLLLKMGIESNANGLFHDGEKRKLAIKQIDDELARIAAQVKRLKTNKSSRTKPLIQPNMEEGNTRVNVTKMMKEIYDLFDLLDQADAAVPDFVEDYIWEADYEKLIVVRSRERFVLKGEGRVVVYAVLETPLTHDVHLIRLGSDYWEDAEAAYDLNEAAFTVERYAGMTEALAEIINAINLEDDLEPDDRDGGAASHYDTRLTLNEKFSRLLS